MSRRSRKLPSRWAGSYRARTASGPIAQIKKHPPDLDEKIETKHTPWDTRPFFLVFVGLLSLEWFLRKRWGLV